MRAQQEIRFGNGWGGRRKGAGRPPNGARAGVPHGKREAFRASEPVHVTLRCARGVPSLRQRRAYHAIRWATLSAARHQDAFRIVHVSIQRDHVHMIVEAKHRMALARGMQGFESSAARLLNRALHHRGRVFGDRYHARILKSPRQVRNALVYVLNNWRKHGEDRGVRWRVDPFSTGVRFGGWREIQAQGTLFQPPPTYEPMFTWLPKTWLLGTGWQRHALISTRERPGLAG